MKIFRLPWSDINSLSLVSEEDRKLPLEYWTYQNEDKTNEEIIIELPQDKKLAEIPENKQFDCSVAFYSMTFDTKTPGKVIVNRHFVRKADQISTKDYAAFRDFLNKVSESDSKQYAIK